VVPEVEPESAAPKPKDASKTDDIFSMFTDEEMEENETSKFAAMLDPVEIEDLLNEVRDIGKHIRK
jgi:hypothetical protein